MPVAKKTSHLFVAFWPLAQEDVAGANILMQNAREVVSIDERW
jgi:hypothetical protein